MTNIDVTMTIGGVDVTDYIIPGTLNIQNVLTSQVDQCTCTLMDAAAVRPEVWSEIIVLDGSTRIFGGYVLSVDEIPGPNLGINFNVRASDYSVRLEKTVVREQYWSSDDNDIIADIFANYLNGEGFDVSTYVDYSRSYDSIRFNRISVLSILQLLAKMGDSDWYVDENKKLHFFKTDTNPAPFGLSDSPDNASTYPYAGLQISRDGSGVINRVEVTGGTYLSTDATIYVAGTGQDKRLSIPLRVVAPTTGSAIQVWRNDGTLAVPVWTAMTVKTAYIDQLSGTSDVLYYYQEKALEQQNNWPNLANAVKIFARYEIPLRTRATNKASIDFYGITLDGLIADASIVDKATARLAALAMLAENAMAKTAISLKTYQPGLRAGQNVNLVNGIHGLDQSFLIQKVTCSIGVNGKPVYTIDMGVYDPGLVDMIIRLMRGAKQTPEWRDDEVLDELMQWQETYPIIETMNMIPYALKYYFSEVEAEAFDWGFGAFVE